MTHGVQAYFVERARCANRVAVIAAGLGVLTFAPLIAISLTPLRGPLREFIRRTTRFGYEGPDQFVRRITLQQFQGAGRGGGRQVGALNTRRERAGGRMLAARVKSTPDRPETRPNTPGLAPLDADMMARSVSRLANVPVVQSAELVIEHAATPIYPEPESEKGIEGKVSLQALIDTTGRVVEVQLVGTTGVVAFERSAQEAVWLYRFRPYRPGGRVSEVYAIFRFVFRVY